MIAKLVVGSFADNVIGNDGVRYIADSLPTSSLLVLSLESAYWFSPKVKVVTVYVSLVAVVHEVFL